MPSFSDSIFLFVLALLLFGPKKLPVLARELGKWVGEFRRASNEFKSQMEEELRVSEQEDRNKQIAAMEAAAPLPAPLPGEEEPEHPHLRPLESPPAGAHDLSSSSAELHGEPLPGAESTQSPATETPSGNGGFDQTALEPLPIATSGELRMMPPSTGLPTPRGRASTQESEHDSSNALTGFVNAIPQGEPSHGGAAAVPSEAAAQTR